MCRPLLTAALFSALFTCAQDAQPDMLAGMTALRKADHATAEKAFTAAAAASRKLAATARSCS